MPRPRSSTFYLPLAPVDAPLSLKAKLSVLPPSAANALLAPRAHPPFHTSCAQEANASNSVSSSSLSPSPCMVVAPQEDECARLERVLGLTQGNGAASGGRRNGRRHTDAPLPSGSFSTSAIPPPPLPFGAATSLAAPSTHRPLPPLAHKSLQDSQDANEQMEVDAAGTFGSVSAEMTTASSSSNVTASTFASCSTTTATIPTLTGADMNDSRIRTGTPSSSPNAAIISITVTPSHHSAHDATEIHSFSNGMDVETASQQAGANGVGSESTSITRWSHSFPSSPPNASTSKSTLLVDGSFADNDRSREKAEDACYASGTPEVCTCSLALFPSQQFLPSLCASFNGRDLLPVGDGISLHPFEEAGEVYFFLSFIATLLLPLCLVS
jgi:hypothetical protein